tara:strand:+ start:246 stop:413 length:168 start_codon:yes stop_codon:yes gene_type:complete
VIPNSKSNETFKATIEAYKDNCFDNYYDNFGSSGTNLALKLEMKNKELYGKNLTA